MALIDATDFDDIPYKIPNQSEFPSFVDFIESLEEKFLKNILGYDLYTEFMEALGDSGELDEKWEKLRDGSTYLYGDVTYEYKGLVDLLKPAIYSEWVKYNYRKLTSAGIIVNNGQQNTTTQNPTYEIVTYWNEYCEKVGGSLCQLNTFYGFMEENYEEDYPDWEFSQPYVKNRFDL